MSKKNNIHANCIGYAIAQCYDNGINILGIMKDDADEAAQLQTLKSLVTTYSEALESVEDSSTLQWYVSDELINRIKNATTLDDVYKTSL